MGGAGGGAQGQLRSLDKEWAHLAGPSLRNGPAMRKAAGGVNAPPPGSLVEPAV